MQPDGLSEEVDGSALSDSCIPSTDPFSTVICLVVFASEISCSLGFLILICPVTGIAVLGFDRLASSIVKRLSGPFSIIFHFILCISFFLVGLVVSSIQFLRVIVVSH